MYQDFVSMLKQAFSSDLNCHFHSDINVDSFDCKDLLDKLGSNFLPKLRQLKYLKVGDLPLSQTQEFKTSLVANNADCIKETVTYTYFGGQGNNGSPYEGPCDNAVGFSLIGVLFALLNLI